MNAPDVITFGCRLNAYESEGMKTNALAAGLDNAVIVNTCAVTAEAERQAKQSIRKLRRERPDVRIIVTGCASHIDPSKYSEMPEVDEVVANDKKLESGIFTELEIAQSNPGGIPSPSRGGLGWGAKSWNDNSDILQSDPSRTPPRLTSPTRGEELVRLSRQNGELQRAFVQVQNGCDHRCTFCIIPYGRGASRSMTSQAIAEQTRKQVEQGYREVVFTGVDIASYGKDLPGNPSLGKMIGEVLEQVPELPRLRLSSLDPAAIDDELWELIANEPRLMPHLHLSVQAGDDMVLKRMKRRHLRDDVMELCERARRLRPEVTFGADIIAGFPTETDAMFQNTYDLLKQCEFTWLHVFPYSSRKGTPAAKMPQVNGAIRRERAEKLRELGTQAISRHMLALVGKKFDVLVEQQGLGCTEQFAKVKMVDAAPLGAIVNVECFDVVEGQAVTRLAA